MSTFDTSVELKSILRLGWPMVLTQLFIMLTGFLDAAMAGHYSSVDLAGVSLAGSVLWPCFLLLTGVTMAMVPIASQLRGAGRLSDIGHRVRQALWICSLTSTVLVIILLNAELLFEFAGVDAAVTAVAIGYLDAAVWGIPAVVFYVGLRHVCEGLGKTVPPMVIAGVVILPNAALNYAFIYGKFGLPELGGVGCGWATAIVFWLELLLMMWVVRQRFFKDTRVFERFEWPNPQTVSSITKIGAPIGLSIFLEMAVFSVIAFLVARIGVIEVAANTIAGNLNWLTYVIPMSLGSAASIRVGFHVGAGDYPAARATAATVYKFSIVYALIVSVLLVLLRYQLVGIYTTDPQVIELAAIALLFIAVYQIVDDSQAVTLGALRGYKDTQVPMYVGLLSYWVIALPVGHLLALGIPGMGIEPLGLFGYWTGLTLGLTIGAICMGIRLWHISGDHDKILALARV